MNLFIEKGESFLNYCLFDGLAHSLDVTTKKYTKPYPEVTGYVIKYLCEYKQGAYLSNVVEAVEYLIKIQHMIGGYKTFYNNRYLYTFDTAQIVNGLISFYSIKPNEQIYETINKAGEFLIKMLGKEGDIYPVYDLWFKLRRKPPKLYSLWNGPTSGLLCKITEAFQSLYALTIDERYHQAIKKIGDFYKKVNPIIHTHPLGYWLEGLLAAGEVDFVKNYLKDHVIHRIEKNGFISYDGKVRYSYTSGEAQLAILMKKVGFVDEALIIRNYLRNVQNKHISGGIFQYTTPDGDLDTTIHSEINSWGTKYFCELERLLDNET